MITAVFQHDVHTQIHCALTPQCEHRGSCNLPGFVCACVCDCVHVHMSGNLDHSIMPEPVSQLMHELKVKKMLLLQLGSSNHKSPLGILVWGGGRMTL